MEFLKKILRTFLPLAEMGAWVRDRRRWFSSYGSRFVSFYPAGHFYSPLPDLADVEARQDLLFDRSGRECPGVTIDDAGQLALLDGFAQFAADWCFPQTQEAGFRYYTQQRVFERFDAMILFAMMRQLAPRRVVEVGSGFSSALMLDTDDRFLGSKTRFSFIEPYPDRLYGLLSDSDRTRKMVQECAVQEADLAVVEELEAGDIFFVDSSHVVKIGSDVNFLVFEVLPRLQPGTVVHFHDVFWPFEYPADWVRLGRAWNETYLLRAFLQYNSSFEILFHNSYMEEFHGDEVHARLPMVRGTRGSSLWLRKVS